MFLGVGGFWVLVRCFGGRGGGGGVGGLGSLRAVISCLGAGWGLGVWKFLTFGVN